MTLPCAYVLSAPANGSLVLCGSPVVIYDSGRALCSRHDPEESFIYVVQRGQYVKIGVTVRPEQRLMDVIRGVGCKTPPDLGGAPLLLALVRGNVRTERLFHAAFAPYRAEGEWFRVEGTIADWIGTMEAVEYDMVKTAIKAERLLDEDAEDRAQIAETPFVDF